MAFEQLKSVALVNGETMTYRTQGEGPIRLMLLHGNMSSSKHWDVVVEQLGSEFTVVALDMRGFGGSTYHTPISSLKDFSDDLRLFCDAIDFHDFTFVGWSTGGGVGLQFVSDHEGYANKLLLMSSMSTRGYPYYAFNEQGEIMLEQRLTTKEQIEAQPQYGFIQTAYDAKDKDYLRAVWNAAIYTARQPEESRYEHYIDVMLEQRNLMDIYHALNTFNVSSIDHAAARGTARCLSLQLPILIVYGDRDFVVPEPMTLELIEDLPQANSVKLADCGHSPQVDQLNELISHLSEFARS